MTRASQDRIQSHTMRILTFMTALTLLLGSSRVTAQEAPAPTPQTQSFQPFFGSPSPFPFQGFAGLPGAPNASPRPLNPFFAGTFNGQPTGNPFLPPLVGPNQQFAFPAPQGFPGSAIPGPQGFPGSAIPGPQFQAFPGSPQTGRPPPQGITNGFPGQFSHPGSFQIQPNLSGQSSFPSGSFPDTSPITPLREVPPGFPAAVNDAQISGRGLEFGNEDLVGLSNGNPTTQAPISPVTPLSSPPTTPATIPPTSTASPTTTTTSTTSKPSTTPPPTTTTTSTTPPPTTTTPPPTTTTNLPSTTTSTTTSASTAQPTVSTTSSTTVSPPTAEHKSRTQTGNSLASRLQNFAQQASNNRGEGKEKVSFSQPSRTQDQESRGESEAQRQRNTISASGGQSSQDTLSEAQYDYDYDQAASDKESQPAASPATSTTTTPLPVSVSTEKAKKKGRKQLTRTQQFLERLQKLRQRRLTSTTGRPRRTDQEQDNNVQDNQVPPRRRTPQRQTGSSFNSRLRDRVFASRSPTGGRRNRISDDKNSSSGFRATRRPVIIHSFTTKRPLTIRERLELHRQNNRFVPKHLRTTTKRTTTTTLPPSTTTTTTTTTTEIPSIATDEDYDYFTDYEPEAPALEVTERAPTTTTTQKVPVTRVATTERTNSKVQSIRERIAAMLGASGLAGKTTTEEVLTILEEVTVKPLLTADTATQSSVTVTDNPVLMVHTDEDFEPTEMPLDEILSTIIETIATSELPPTTQALHSSQPSFAQTTPTPESLPFVSVFTSNPEVSTTSKPAATDETEIPFPHTTPNVLTSVELEVDETNPPSGTVPEFTDSTAAALTTEHTETPETVAETLKQPTTEDPLVQDLIAQLVAEGIITEVNSKSDVTVPEVNEEPLTEETLPEESLPEETLSKETLIEETGPTDVELTNVEKNPAAEVQPVISLKTQMLNEFNTDTEISEKEHEIIAGDEADIHESLTKSNESQKAINESHTIIPIDEHVIKPTLDVNDESKVMTDLLLDSEDQTEVARDNLQEPEKQTEITEHVQMTENVADISTNFRNQTDTSKGQEDQVEVIDEPAQKSEDLGEDTLGSGDQADVMASVTEEAGGEAEVTEVPQELMIQDENDLNQTVFVSEPLKDHESPKEATDDLDPTEEFIDQPIVTEELGQRAEEQISFTETSIGSENQEEVTETSIGSENQEEVTEIPAELSSAQLRTGDQAIAADIMTIANEEQILGNENETLTENITEMPEDMITTETVTPEDLTETDGKQTTLIENFESTTEKQITTTSQTQLTGSQTRTTPLAATTESTLLTDVTDNPTTFQTTEEIIASELETDPFVTLSEDAELTVDLLTSTDLPPSTTTEIPTTSRLPSSIKIPVLSNRTTTTMKPSTTTQRSPGFNPSSPRVSTVKMLDTTTRFQKSTTTDLPPTTVPESQLEDYITTNDDALETPPAVHITEVPLLHETTTPGEITPTEENEVDTTRSMNHLHMLLHSFGSTSIRPELAAMNRVLDFSLSSTDPVEQLGLNHEVTGIQNFDFDYDLEPASTEQVIVTTSLQTPTFAALGSDNQGIPSTEHTTSTQGIMLTETNTPTILNMEVAVLTVSEPYSKVQNFTEAPETTQMPMSTSTTESSTMENIPETTTETVTDPMETTTMPPVTTTEKIEVLDVKEPVIVSNKSNNSVKTLANQLSTTEGTTTVEVTTPTTSPEEKESDAETNEEVSVGNTALSREDRERQRLAWLRKNSGKDGEQPRPRQLQSTQRRTFVPLGNVRSTAERPASSATGRRLSLSDLLSQRASPTGSTAKTSSSQRENDIPTFTSTTTQAPRVQSQTVKVDLEPIVVKETQPQPVTEQAPDPKNGAKQSEALRRFLELNKQMLKALAEKKTGTTALPDEPTTTSSPEQGNTRPKFTTRTPPRLDKFRALTESTVNSNDNEESSTINVIPKNRVTNPVAPTRKDSTQGFQPRPSTFLRPVASPKPSEASSDDRTVQRVRPAFISPPPSTSSRSDPPSLLPESRTDNTATRTRSRLPPPIRRPRPRIPGRRPGGPIEQNVPRPLTARPTRFDNPSEKRNEKVTQAPSLSRESVSESVAEAEKKPVQPPRRFGSSTSAPRRNQFTTPRGRRKGFRKRVQNNRVSTPRRRKPTAIPRFTTEFEEVTTHIPTTTVPEFTTLPQEEDVTISGFEHTTQDFFDTTLRSDLERATFPPEEETTLQEFSSVTSRGRVRFENRHRPTPLPRITERPGHRSTLASKVAAFSNNEDATVQPVTRPLKPDTPEPPKPSSTFKPFEFETSATTISPTRFFTESPSGGGISTFTGFDFDLDTTPPTTFAEGFEESTQSSADRFVNSQNFVHTTFSPFGDDNQKQSIFPKLHQTTSSSHISRPSHSSDLDEAFFAEEDPPFVNRKETETFPPVFPITPPSNPFFGEIQETETFPPDDFFHKETKETETFPPAFPITTPENPFFGEIKDADAFPPSLTITPPSNSFFVNNQDTTTFSPDFATTVRPNFEFDKKQEVETALPPFQTTIPPNTVTPRIIVVALPILNQAPASPSNSNHLPPVSSPQSPVSERVVSPVNQESSSPFPDVIPPQTDKPLGHVQVTSEAGFIPREVHRPSTLTGGVKITAEQGFIPRDVVLQPPPSPPPQPDQTHTTFTLQNDNGRSGTLHGSGHIEFVNDHAVSSQGSFSSSPSTTTQVPSRPVITVDSLLTFLGNDSNSNNERVVPKRPSLSLTPTTNPPSPIGTTLFTPNFKLQSTRFFNQRNDTPSISPKFSVPTTISPPLKSLLPSPLLDGRPIIRDEFFNAPVSGFTPPTTLLPPENPSTRQSILLRPLESLTPPSVPFTPSTSSPGNPPPQTNFQQNRGGSPLRPFLPPSPTTSRPRTSTLAGILSTLINKKPTTTEQSTTTSPTTPPQPFTTQDPIIVPTTDPPFSNQLGTGPPAPASIQPPFGNKDPVTGSESLKPFDGDRNHLSHQEPVIPTRTGDTNLPSRSNGQDFSRLPSPSSRPGPPSLESIPSQNAFDGRGDIRFSVQPSSDKDSPSEGSADAPPALTPSQFPSSAAPGAAVENDPDDDHVPGLGGVDYPILQAIPKTSFKCTKEMRLSGRMFADPETACQVYHVCSGHQTFSFLCPRGTIFHQDTFVCQWWFTVDCQAQAQKLAQIQAQSGR
ncbi:mucin-2-like [Penaeus indicus]|uniref:mucin-2-like n=1 Tax=Penaeus indicus TaxID=29960 RepID=UPI00300C4A3B